MTNNNKLLFSVFENLNGIQGAFQTTPTQTLNFNELVNYYNSQENKELSQAILLATTPEEKNKLKSKRAYFTPYGTFSIRRNANILEHNNIVSIDIDGLKNEEEAEEIRNQLAKHPSTLFALLSTRGKGVKAMMFVDTDFTAEEQFNQLKHVFKPYLKEFLKINADKIDEAQFKLSQPCYFSFDADMFINAEAEPLKLDFNYKEPERKPFKTVTVPTSANTNIETYVLRVLQNKVDLLTPDGARHPKLANIKALAELIHYAPQLENQILSTFIQAGEQMYSANEKASVKGVRKNVLDAWNIGINSPANNSTLDKIIDSIDETIKANKITADVILKTNITLKTKYISQDKEAMKKIEQVINSNNIVNFIGGTGIGKAVMIKALTRTLKHKIICAVPTITIAKQQAFFDFFDGTQMVKRLDKNCDVVIGGINGAEVEMIEDSKLIFVTYASLHKLKNIKGKILIIDESHLLSDRSTILFEQIKTIKKVMHYVDKTVFVSATPNPLLDYVFKTAIIEVKRKKEPKTIINTVFYNKQTKVIDAVRTLVTNKDFDINYMFVNDKKFIEEVRQELIKLKVYSAEEIAVFTADVCDVESENYIKLVEEQIVSKNIKCILSTSKISEGVNIKNKESVNFVFIGKDINLLRQSYKRFRESKNVKVTVLFSDSFRTKIGVAINTYGCYNTLKKDVQQEVKDFADFTEDLTEDKEELFINTDFETRATFKINGKMFLNVFELMHEVKKIQEHYMSFEIWKQEVKSVIPNVIFNEPVSIEVKENKDLALARKERKQERENFLNKVQETLVTNPNEILDYARQNSKNDNLKGFINKRLHHVEIEYLFTEDERILFFKNYSTIEKYINNIIKLSEVLNTTFDKSINVWHNEDEAKSNFKSFYNFYLLLRIEEAGAKTRDEYRFKKKADKINTVFTDGGAINKEYMFNILRSEFKYKLSSINLAVVNQYIGFVFNVSYDRKSKLFTLNKKYKKNLFSYSNETKVCTNENHIEQGFKEDKQPIPPSGNHSAKQSQKILF